MIIYRNISKYTVLAEDSILNALKKLSDNQGQIIFSVTAGGVLEGVLTDRDLRCWLVQQESVDLNQPVSRITNKQVKTVLFGENPSYIQTCRSQDIKYIPLVDAEGHLLAIANYEPKQVKLNQLTGEQLGALIDNSIQGSVDVKQAILESMNSSIAAVAQQIIATLSRGKKILVMGNGGSAADAQHLAAEFVVRFEKDRLCLPAIALTVDTSILTALVNDYGSQSIFARQIEGLGEPGDLLLAISTSGNSENILKGVQAALGKGLTVIGLTGQKGGRLVDLCHLSLCVPSLRTSRIQEAHTMICHILCEAVEAALCTDTDRDDTFRENVTPDLERGEKLLSRPESLSDYPELGNIKLLILDFDGVLTDNRVLLNQEGTEAVWCNRGDGWGIARLKEAGIEILVLSTETNKVVSARCQKLDIGCIHGCDDKLSALEEIVRQRSVRLEEVAYVGNDVNDLACMSHVGMPIAVADAVPEIKNLSRIVTCCPGGYGAVREVADLILSTSNSLKRRPVKA